MKLKNKDQYNSITVKLKKENKAQSSSEMILLIGLTLIVVLIIGKIIFQISSNMNLNLKNLIETGRNSTLKNL